MRSWGDCRLFLSFCVCVETGLHNLSFVTESRFKSNISLHGRRLFKLRGPRSRHGSFRDVGPRSSRGRMSRQPWDPAFSSLELPPPHLHPRHQLALLSCVPFCPRSVVFGLQFNLLLICCLFAALDILLSKIETRCHFWFSPYHVVILTLMNLGASTPPPHNGPNFSRFHGVFFTLKSS